MPRRLLALLIFLLPGVASAQLVNRFIVVNSGTPVRTFVQLMDNLMVFLVTTIVSVTVVLFLVGAVHMVASAGKPELLEKGKKLMKNSLIGLALVLGSYTILRTIFFLLYI